MAWRSASLSRSLISTARASLRPSPSAPLPRLRPPPPLTVMKIFFVWHRNLGELGCTQSLLPLHNTMVTASLTSHFAVSARACCELSHGRNGKDG
ncbi:uncharacterized protein G2W53_003061 [Senna tora]|uniref:Uncharacterized protein n=1 Tax=Senna tora TaxID=362788 RepID=A0A834XC14_9FABA|nr:uncharacterized protein G2W53_003061 [Senna tora]